MAFNATLRSILVCVAAITQLASLTFAQTYHESDLPIQRLTVGYTETDDPNQPQDNLPRDDEQSVVESIGDDIIAAGEAVLHRFLKDYYEGEWIDAYLDMQMQDDGIVIDHQQATLALLSDQVDKDLAARALFQPTRPNEMLPPNQTASLQSLEADGDQSLQQFAVSLPVLNYGVLSTHQTKERTFAITNTGTTTLTGNVTTNSPFHRIISGGSFALAPAASQTVTLRFLPSRPGLYLANAVVNSERGTISVLLKGIVN